MATSKTDRSRQVGDGSNGRTANCAQAVRLLIVSKSRLYREGLAAMLSGGGTIDVVGTAESAADALKAMPSGSYEVVLFDIADASGTGGVRELLRERSESRIVVLGVSELSKETLGVSEFGVAACLTQSAGLDQAIEAIERVAIDPHFVVARGKSRSPSMEDGDGERRLLTPREIEVLTLVDRGLSNKEIANQLYIELATVKNHVHSILQKLNVQRRALAAAWLRNREPSSDGNLDP
jgi:two-component system nitrate/nitrite response regulator NarL